MNSNKMNKIIRSFKINEAIFLPLLQFINSINNPQRHLKTATNTAL